MMFFGVFIGVILQVTTATIPVFLIAGSAYLWLLPLSIARSQAGYRQHRLEGSAFSFRTQRSPINQRERFAGARFLFRDRQDGAHGLSIFASSSSCSAG